MDVEGHKQRMGLNSLLESIRDTCAHMPAKGTYGGLTAYRTVLFSTTKSPITRGCLVLIITAVFDTEGPSQHTGEKKGHRHLRIV